MLSSMSTNCSRAIDSSRTSLSVRLRAMGMSGSIAASTDFTPGNRSNASPSPRITTHGEQLPSVTAPELDGSESEQRFDQPSGHEAPPTMSFLSRAAATSTAKCIDSCSARRRPLALSR